MFGCQSLEKSLEKSLDINQNSTSILKISKNLHKVWVFESKKPVFGSKSLEKVQKKFGNCSIPKITKNDVKLELWKLQKTRSDLKTDLKVRLKVRNAGP